MLFISTEGILITLCVLDYKVTQKEFFLEEDFKGEICVTSASQNFFGTISVPKEKWEALTKTQEKGINFSDCRIFLRDEEIEIWKESLQKIEERMSFEIKTDKSVFFVHFTKAGAERLQTLFKKLV